MRVKVWGRRSLWWATGVGERQGPAGWKRNEAMGGSSSTDTQDLAHSMHEGAPLRSTDGCAVCDGICGGSLALPVLPQLQSPLPLSTLGTGTDGDGAGTAKGVTRACLKDH